MSGSLVLVATPIGNLADMSFRAVETLKRADVIACEDTRHTRKLLNHYEITGVPVMAVHEHNEAVQAHAIVERIRNGETVAYVTDAGMPAISDPGERLVAATAQEGLLVTVVPGASAGISALAVSGLPTDRFVFEGFLPRKGSERSERIETLAGNTATTVVYEAPTRLTKTLEDLARACGDTRRVSVVRELTKVYEEVKRGSFAELIDHYAATTVKGECVIVIDAAPPQAEASDDEIRLAVEQHTRAGMSKRDAIAAVARTHSVPKNRVYELTT